MTTIAPFTPEGLTSAHFGEDARGIYVQLSPFSRALGYVRASDALRHLDDNERGTAICRTPGGDQRVSVIYEAGMWRLIFRSNLPAARELTTRVTEILAEIRRTGSYGVPSRRLPKTYAEALRDLAAEVEAREAVQQELEAARPAVQFVQDYTDTTGLYQVAEVAAILKVRGMGRNNLFNFLRERGVLYRANGQNLPKREHIEAQRFELKAQKYEGSNGHEVATSTPYVTAKGLLYIRDLLRRNGYECMGTVGE